MVSAYESGSREPGFETLSKLVGATGFSLDFTLTPAATRSPLQERVHQHRQELTRTLGKLGASNIRLFGSVARGGSVARSGSVARGGDGPESDVDLSVDVNEDIGMFALGQMRSEAERMLGVAVDVVPSNSLKHELTQAALKNSVPR